MNGCNIPSPSNFVQQHSSSGGCGAADAATIARLSSLLDVAIPVNTSSFVFTCGENLGGNVVQVNAFSNPGCAGFPTTIQSLKTLNICQASTNVPGNTIFIRGCEGRDCFHQGTKIEYKGRELSILDLDLGSEEECTIPHIVESTGMKLKADCGSEEIERILIATPGHLVYTKERGMVAMKDLTTSDVVFGDEEEKKECRVVSVERETESAKYFGLNCHKSVVLASGVKCSTFERLHTVPSFWMSILSKIVGVKRASALGDYIEKTLHRLSIAM